MSSKHRLNLWPNFMKFSLPSQCGCWWRHENSKRKVFVIFFPGKKGCSANLSRGLCAILFLLVLRSFVWLSFGLECRCWDLFSFSHRCFSNIGQKTVLRIVLPYNVVFTSVLYQWPSPKQIRFFKPTWKPRRENENRIRFIRGETFR